MPKLSKSLETVYTGAGPQKMYVVNPEIPICSRCRVPMVLMPNMFGQFIHRCPACGGVKHA